MLATFKETITSLRDPKYGQIIIAKPLKSVVWYWTKYLLLVSFIPMIIAIVLLTRFLPEAPKLVEKKLPEGTLGSKNHELFTTIQPLDLKIPETEGSGPFRFIFDLNASPSAAESMSDGVLVLKDQLIVKTSDGRTQIQTFEKLPDFSTDKSQIAGWIRAHRYQIWTAGFIVILLVTAVISGITWVFRFLIFLVWTLVSWLVAKYLMKKSLTYLQVLNIVIYSSIIPLLLSLILTLTPNPILSLLNTGIFVFFIFTWIKNISPSAAVTSSAPLPSPVKKSRTRT